jgi:hypothetical protein
MRRSVFARRNSTSRTSIGRDLPTGPTTRGTGFSLPVRSSATPGLSRSIPSSWFENQFE